LSIGTDISFLGGIPSAFDVAFDLAFAFRSVACRRGVEAAVVVVEGIVPEGSHDAPGRYGSADRHSVVRGSMCTHVGFPQDGAPD
jgi:hypothetical protein